MPLEWVEELQRSGRETNNEVQVGTTACHLVEVMTHWDCRRLVCTLIHIMFQIRYLWCGC